MKSKSFILLIDIVQYQAIVIILFFWKKKFKKPLNWAKSLMPAVETALVSKCLTMLLKDIQQSIIHNSITIKC